MRFACKTRANAQRGEGDISASRTVRASDLLPGKQIDWAWVTGGGGGNVLAAKAVLLKAPFQTATQKRGLRVLKIIFGSKTEAAK